MSVQDFNALSRSINAGVVALVNEKTGLELIYNKEPSASDLRLYATGTREENIIATSPRGLRHIIITTGSGNVLDVVGVVKERRKGKGCKVFCNGQASTGGVQVAKFNEGECRYYATREQVEDRFRLSFGENWREKKANFDATGQNYLIRYPLHLLVLPELFPAQRHVEGWDIFNTDGFWNVQKDDEKNLIADDNAACRLAQLAGLVVDAEGYLLGVDGKRILAPFSNEKQFLSFLGTDETWPISEQRQEAERIIYKGTECGAWIKFDNGSILVGSIVEGADIGTATYRLAYPFTQADYAARIDAVEKEADALWKWANEQDCEGDAPDVDRDFQHLNPEGRSC